MTDSEMFAVLAGFLKLDKTRPCDVEKMGWPEVVADPTSKRKSNV
jgi:hypothetical protein